MMTALHVSALGPRQQGFVDASDRMMYLTLSLYLSSDKIEEAIGTSYTVDNLRTLQKNDPNSTILRDAIDPLFNDIADRERLAKVDEIILAATAPVAGDLIEITAPETLVWQTEGKTFHATPPGLSKPRRLLTRRFWYGHADGALSYHVSFSLGYDHTPGDFYFLSLLQKVLAPKEFSSAPHAGMRRPTASALTGIQPLDEVCINDGTKNDLRFWHYIKNCFEVDADTLLNDLSQISDGKRGKSINADFDHLVSHIPFIEVPGLEMPLARFKFFFQDKGLFNRLLPPILPGNNVRQPRAIYCQDQCYAPYIERIDALLKEDAAELRDQGSKPVVHLDTTYWDWVMTRPDYASLTDTDLTEIQQRIPAFEARHRPDCLQYMFLSGFNQNIIDFMNQDASEILDSLDPIYPTNDEQDSEAFFVRFANPRALITYVRSSRSLETGNDYLGTCPYAFLVHVCSFHNECLARNYEEEAFALIANVETFNQKRQFKKAAEVFYDFRMSAYAGYQRHRSRNIFRYDTEGDVFDAMERLRGTSRRETYLESLVSNVESQTRDLEARIQKSDEQRLNYVLGALGVFSLFQLVFNWAEVLSDFNKRDTESIVSRVDLVPPFIHQSDGPHAVADQIAIHAMQASMIFASMLVLYLIYLVIRRIV
jgi:hypothetical protein